MELPEAAGAFSAVVRLRCYPAPLRTNLRAESPREQRCHQIREKSSSSRTRANFPTDFSPNGLSLGKAFRLLEVEITRFARVARPWKPSPYGEAEVRNRGGNVKSTSLLLTSGSLLASSKNLSVYYMPPAIADVSASAKLMEDRRVGFFFCLLRTKLRLPAESAASLTGRPAAGREPWERSETRRSACGNDEVLSFSPPFARPLSQVITARALLARWHGIALATRGQTGRSTLHDRLRSDFAVRDCGDARMKLAGGPHLFITGSINRNRPTAIQFSSQLILVASLEQG